MSRASIATLAGVILLAGLIPGCGDGTGDQQAPIASDKPDGGLEASKSIMKMQPPPPPRPGRGR